MKYKFYYHITPNKFEGVIIGISEREFFMVNKAGIATSVRKCILIYISYEQS